MEAPQINKGGRPYKYTVDQFNKLADEYIQQKNTEGKPITKTGLALYVGMCKDSITDLADKEGYSEAIKRVEQAGEQYEIDFLHSGKNPAGAIFVLKNLHGWTDKQEINHTGTIVHALQPADWEAMEQRVIEARQRRLQEPTIEADFEVIQPAIQPDAEK